tara:strand:+ start:31 stop:777 length:747 start_codon:yes stop_codon:yes gene_type:complete
MKQKFILVFIFMVLGCDVDEEPPKFPSNLRGVFTLSEGTPKVKISWEKSTSVDVSEYHIFKASGLEGAFDSLTNVASINTIYIDTNITWQEHFGYKIRAKDQSKNIGGFSDSVFIECYKPVGEWNFSEFDSLSICIDPITFNTPPSFQIKFGDTLTALGDTIGRMNFSESILDSTEWIGNGWMVYNYSTLELNENQEYEIVTENKLPEYYQIELINPDSGRIFFLSGSYESIYLNQSVKDCEGNLYFP